MKIEIDLPRPWLTLSIVACLVVGGLHVREDMNIRSQLVSAGGTESSVDTMVTESGSVASEAVLPQSDAGGYADDIAALGQGGGMDALVAEQSVAQGGGTSAGDNVELARVEQQLLERKLDILRGQIKFLDAERRALGDKVSPEIEDQFAQSTRILTALTQDQRRADEFLTQSLREMWDAQTNAAAYGREIDTSGESAPTILLWPVEPRLGLSAYFHDPSYAKRFGFQHDAVDVPTAQGTVVVAAADGEVKEVADHGLGFNYITIKHPGGFVTLYGHLSKFLVKPGDHVQAGSPIGYSGGRPGTAGAGLSTGPHLHFGVFRGGKSIDPLLYLPAIQEESSSSEE